ncbi:LRR domain containing protein [Parasponia andersonii]|uniref:LRR domain containing protein n=1 Tax=Parasponia andersonii TaxID=3476 RepID=A0A2P5AM55_PARAD|nr:LRR domain containing protein [Parasponia andersonii]
MLSKLTESIVFQTAERVSELLVYEAASLTSVKDDVERLRAELRRMQCFLRDAESKQERYLGESIDRCMVQVNKMDYTGMGAKTCRMHDLMREFCVSKARENLFEIIQHEINKNLPGSSSFQHFPATRSRRISVHLGQCLDYPALSFEQVHPHLRSLLCFATHSRSILPLKNKSFRLLRVLELGQIRVAPHSQMLREIGNLIHLRYLGLKSAKIVNLPHSIGNLRILHTLDLRNNDGIRMPRAVSGLIRLRHLLLPYGGILFQTGEGIIFEWIS